MRHDDAASRPAEDGRAEPQLLEGEEKFQYVFEAANVGKSITLPSGEISVNKAFADLLGYTRQELERKTWQDLTPPDDIDATQASLQPLLDGREDSIRFDKRYVHKDGSFVWADVSAVIRRAEDGTPLYFVTTIVDISERRRAEEEILRMEERFSSAFHVSPAGMTITRIADGTFIDANSAFLDMFGFAREEVIGRTSTALGMWSTEEREKLIRQQLESGGLRDFELQAQAKSGRVVNILFSSAATELQGEMCHITTMVDISERKRAEELVREQQSILATAEQVARIGSWRWDLNTGKLTWSDEMFNLFGVDRAGFDGDLDRVIAERIHPEDVPAVLGANRGILDGANPLPLSYRVLLPDGEERVVVAQGKLFRDEQGAPTALIGYAQDITERVRAEAALRASEERFRMLFEYMPDGLVIADADFVYTDVNPSFCRMLGYARDEIVGQRASKVVVPEETERIGPELLEEVGGRPDYLEEWRFRRKDDSVFVAEVLAATLPDGSPIGLVRDVTERKRAEEERESLQAQLAQAQKLESVGRLAGGIAHDFNNMLGVILGHAELMLGAMGPDGPFRAELEEIKDAGERSAALTRQLLAFARRQTVDPKVLDVNATLEGMLKMLRRVIGEDIQLAWLPGQRVWPVKVDPGQVDQILANLCVNARDAIDGVGRVTIETDNRVFDEDYCAAHVGFTPGDFVMLAVSDDGVGMDKPTLASIFEPFFTTKEPSKGTGLGLATVYGIVRQNEGFINVYSEPAHGSTFRVYLPRHVGEEGEAPMQAPPAQPPRGRETILLVEDEPAILHVTTRMLEAQGYTVLAANGAGEAIRLAEAHPGRIHLLMTDVVMPEMNGRDLAEKLQSIYPDLKSLFASGYTVNVIAHRGVLDEGVHFIQKPFSMHDLALKVRLALE